MPSYIVSIKPGPSSTDKGLPVRRTGSPTVTPAGMQSAKAQINLSSSRTGLLVDLNSGLVCFYTDHLAHQRIVAHFAELVHGNPNHVFGDNNGTRDGEDGSILLVVTRITLLCGGHPSVCAGGCVQSLKWLREGKDGRAVGA